MPLELLSYTDTVQPFLIHHSSIRGRIVRLTQVADTILHRHAYPDVVSQVLAELLVIATMLSANLKGKGILTLQLKGEGPVKFMVVDATAEGALRGYASVDPDAEESLSNLSSAEATLSTLFGKGYIAITLDQGSEPYQGIVELTGDTLTETIQAYFTHSEQSEVMLKISVTRPASDAENQPWCAGGIMLQHVPGEGGIGLAEGSRHDEDPGEQWRRASILSETLKDSEIADIYLPPAQLLYRLFNDDGVWVYDASHVAAGCRCSRTKILNTLQSFPAEDMASMAIEGIITVTCQFCNQDEVFALSEL